LDRATLGFVLTKTAVSTGGVRTTVRVGVCVGEFGRENGGQTGGVGGCAVALVSDVLFGGGEEVACFGREV